MLCSLLPWCLCMDFVVSILLPWKIIFYSIVLLELESVKISLYFHHKLILCNKELKTGIIKAIWWEPTLRLQGHCISFWEGIRDHFIAFLHIRWNSLWINNECSKCTPFWNCKQALQFQSLSCTKARNCITWIESFWCSLICFRQEKTSLYLRSQ